MLGNTVAGNLFNSAMRALNCYAVFGALHNLELTNGLRLKNIFTRRFTRLCMGRFLYTEVHIIADLSVTNWTYAVVVVFLYRHGVANKLAEASAFMNRRLYSFGIMCSYLYMSCLRMTWLPRGFDRTSSNGVVPEDILTVVLHVYVRVPTYSGHNFSLFAQKA